MSDILIGSRVRFYLDWFSQPVGTVRRFDGDATYAYVEFDDPATEPMWLAVSDLQSETRPVPGAGCRVQCHTQEHGILVGVISAVSGDAVLVVFDDKSIMPCWVHVDQHEVTAIADDIAPTEVLDIASESVEMRMVRDFLNFMGRESTKEMTGVDAVDWLPENVIEWARTFRPSPVKPVPEPVAEAPADAPVEPAGGIPYAAAWRAPSTDVSGVNDVRTQRIIGSLVTAHHRKQVQAWTHTASHFLGLKGDMTGFSTRVQVVTDAAILFGKGLPKSQGRRWWQVYYIILHLCPDGLDALIGSTWATPEPEPEGDSGAQ